jgi:D-arabinose 1-dehydrogenase-like Zn-dependent alcohol dehydrogenase
MKAAVVHVLGKPLSIEEVPVPVPGPGEVLVKVAACGVCHTDLHAADGDWPVKPSPPFIPGHEAVGVIAALGPNVTSLKEGDPVGVAWLHDACMNCEYCETGWETLCEQQHNTGYSCNGGFAEYVIGAASFDARSPDAVASIVKATGGGAHGVLVTAVSPPAFSQALQMVRRKGTISLVGLPPGDFPTPIFDVVLKRITVRGSIVGTRRDLDEAIAFAAEGKVRAEIKKAPLQDINAIFADLKRGKIEGRMVLDFP